jgi:hypothetical protein
MLEAMNLNDGQSLRGTPLDEILLKRRGLRRRLSAWEHLYPIRIAVLGGSTTSEIVDLLDLWLLERGFAPVFYQSDNGRYYVGPLHRPEKLIAFNPDLVYIHTSCMDIQNFPRLQASDGDCDVGCAC